MYQCFHCGRFTVMWDSDADFSDFDYEGQGIVHFCHCANCGAFIQYIVPVQEEENETESGTQ